MSEIICKNIIEFQKADYIAKQSAEALAFVKNGLDKYIAIWNLFAQKEYDYAKKIAGRAGSLRYKKIHKLENNEYVFEISNKENGENFIRELDKIDKESRRVVTKKEITTSRGTRIKNYIFSISSISFAFCPDSILRLDSSLLSAYPFFLHQSLTVFR